MAGDADTSTQTPPAEEHTTVERGAARPARPDAAGCTYDGGKVSCEDLATADVTDGVLFRRRGPRGLLPDPRELLQGPGLDREEVRQGGRQGLASRSSRARSSLSSASRAAARRPPGAPCCASRSRRAATSSTRACRRGALLAAHSARLPQEGADHLPGPLQLDQSQADDLRHRRRAARGELPRVERAREGGAGHQGDQRGGAAAGRPSTCTATRTSSPAGSGSASASPARPCSSPT